LGPGSGLAVMEWGVEVLAMGAMEVLVLGTEVVAMEWGPEVMEWATEHTFLAQGPAPQNP